MQSYLAGSTDYSWMLLLTLQRRMSLSEAFGTNKSIFWPQQMEVCISIPILCYIHATYTQSSVFENDSDDSESHTPHTLGQLHAPKPLSPRQRATSSWVQELSNHKYPPEDLTIQLQDIISDEDESFAVDSAFVDFPELEADSNSSLTSIGTDPAFEPCCTETLPGIMVNTCAVSVAGEAQDYPTSGSTISLQGDPGLAKNFDVFTEIPRMIRASEARASHLFERAHHRIQMPIGLSTVAEHVPSPSDTPEAPDVFVEIRRLLCRSASPKC